MLVSLERFFMVPPLLSPLSQSPPQLMSGDETEDELGQLDKSEASYCNCCLCTVKLQRSHAVICQADHPVCEHCIQFSLHSVVVGQKVREETVLGGNEP